ncbi:DUF2164 domain-containing protein [Virgibacillus sp. DJP39]|uniref:DUF2164 domain-containing protein n=1 Tax=Virgibacillus sp. DJP39 TaxID=3409790 RepID=UPI003BB490A6
MKSKFQLTKEQKDDMAGLIKGYFEKERGEDISHLASLLIFDFITEEIAPLFYNKGVEDAHAFMTSKLDDLFEIQK